MTLYHLLGGELGHDLRARQKNTFPSDISCSMKLKAEFVDFSVGSAVLGFLLLFCAEVT